MFFCVNVGTYTVRPMDPVEVVIVDRCGLTQGFEKKKGQKPWKMLGGGFKHFLFSPLFGEMIPFD